MHFFLDSLSILFMFFSTDGRLVVWGPVVSETMISGL